MEKMRKFVKRWQGKCLADTGTYVSKEFNTFQNAFKRLMTEVATELGGELVNFNKGHYDVSGFIERNGKFVYFDYSNYMNRSRVDLRNRDAFYCRTAKDSRDYQGGYNNFVSVENCVGIIDKLLTE